MPKWAIALLVFGPTLAIGIAMAVIFRPESRPDIDNATKEVSSTSHATPLAASRPDAESEIQRLKAENEALKRSLISSATKPMAGAEPSDEDFQTFGKEFMTYWLMSERNNWKASSPTEASFSGSVLDFDKRKTDSVLHPVVSVIIAKEDMSLDNGAGGAVGYRYTFVFSWNGRRWVGLESSREVDFGIGGFERLMGQEIKVNSSTIDAVAISSQK